jgi:hypothetical protein
MALRLRVILLAFLMMPTSYAAAPQALVLTPSTQLVCRAPAKAADGDIRIEFRVHDMQMLTGDMTGMLFKIPGFQIRWMGTTYNAPIAFSDNIDAFTHGQGTDLFLSPAKSRDVIVRFQRHVSTKMLEAEMWNGDGSGYKSATLPIDELRFKPDSDVCEIGGNISLSLDYLRWFKTAVPMGSAPSTQGAGADALDLEFDGTLIDARSGKRIASNRAPSFTASPGYPPRASQGSPRTFTGGHGVLDGSQSASLSGDSNLTLKWEQVSGPSKIVWNSTSVAKPEISGMVFGSYVIRLTVTDKSRQSVETTVKYGNVEIDSDGRVLPAFPWSGKLLGEMLPLGANPWRYFDESHKRLADFFGALQSSEYLDVWNQPGPGTISISKGSTRIKGVQTRFQQSLCKGGSTPVRGATLVVWYPVASEPAHTGRRGYSVDFCQSETELTLQKPWTTSASAQGLHYAVMDEHAVGTWINGSSNANYYDNGVAHLALYSRSGIDTYLGYFRTLEDRWWTMPWIDEGRACSDGDGTFCLAPRLQSLTGIIARALDGRPEMWPGIRALVRQDALRVSQPPSNKTLGDIREEAYATAFLAQMAVFDPDPDERRRWKTLTATVISKHWIPAMLPDGSFRNMTFGYASWNGSGGTVNVTHGSKTVTGVGTHWKPELFEKVSFWTVNPDGVTGGDAISYTASVVSPTQLILNVPYQGPSAGGRGWEANSLVGLGTQPFMLGVVGTAFRFGYQALGDPKIAEMIGKIGLWLSSEGYRRSTRGLWYGRGFPNCEPIADDNPACNGGSKEESRFLSGEIIGALSAAYELGNNPSIREFGDQLYGAEFAKYRGDKGFDGTYVNDFDGPGSWDFQTKKAKDFGFHFGFGAGWSWPAARIGRPK